MKKSWTRPEIHLVRTDTPPEGKRPEALTDEEISAAMSRTVYFRINEGFVSREIAGEMIVVPVGEQTQKINGLIAFSEAGAFLWKLMETRRTRDDLALLLAAEYGAAMEDVAADVDEFLERALAREMIVRC